jgi:hypothetical protein
MPNKDTIAAREDEIIKLASNLGYIESDVSKCLNNMSKVIDNMSNYLKGDIYKSIKDKFSNFEDQFDMIKGNLESFIEDYNRVNNNFNNMGSSISLSEVKSFEKGGDIINVNNEA